MKCQFPNLLTLQTGSVVLSAGSIIIKYRLPRSRDKDADGAIEWPKMVYTYNILSGHFEKSGDNQALNFLFVYLV